MTAPPHVRAEPRWRQPTGPPPARATAGTFAALAIIAIVGGATGLDPFITLAAVLPIVVMYARLRRNVRSHVWLSNYSQARRVQLGLAFAGGATIGLLGSRDAVGEEWFPLVAVGVAAVSTVIEAVWWARRG